MSSGTIRRLLGAIMAMLVIATAAGACAPAPAPTTVAVMRYTGISRTGDTYYFRITDFKAGGTEYFCLTGRTSTGAKAQFRVYDGTGSAGTWMHVRNLEGDYSDYVTLGGTSESGKAWSARIPQGIQIGSDQVSRRISPLGEKCTGPQGWFGK